MVVTTKTRKLRTLAERVVIEEAAVRLRIREARLESGLTQEQLAELLHVHKRTVEEWENSYVPYKRLNDIARVTGKETEWLLHGDQPDPVQLEARLARVEEMLGRVLALLEPDQEAAQR